MQRAYRTLRGSAGRGVDQIGNGFGLCQIKLAVEKGASGELTRFGETRAKVKATREQHLQNNRSAMSLQLKDIFAGKGIGRGKMQQQTAIDHAAIVSVKVAERRYTRLGALATESVGKIEKVSPGDSDDPDTTTALGRSDGGDCFSWR